MANRREDQWASRAGGKDQRRPQGPRKARFAGEERESGRSFGARAQFAGGPKAETVERLNSSRNERGRRPRDGAAANDRRDRQDQIVGRNPVEEALKAGRPIHKLWVLKSEQGRDPRLSRIVREAKEQGATIHDVDRAALDRLAGRGAHQGVVAEVAAHAYVDADALLDRLEAAGKAPFVLVLDELQDGHNLGSILRVADAAGVDLVVLPERRSVSLDSYVAKASAGAIEYVPVARVTNLSRFIRELKDRGFWIYGSSLSATQSHRELDYRGKICLLIGNEGKGISEKLQESCDFLMKIPMAGRINSLNASVATGILCFEAAAQRPQPSLTALPAQEAATGETTSESASVADYAAEALQEALNPDDNEAVATATPLLHDFSVDDLED